MSFKDILQTQKHGMEGLASVGIIGMHMVSGPLVGVAIGYFLDNWLETGPWLKLVFLFIGIGAGFLNVYVDTRGLVTKLNRESASRPGAILANSEVQAGNPGDETEDEKIQHDRRP